MLFVDVGVVIVVIIVSGSGQAFLVMGTKRSLSVLDLLVTTITTLLFVYTYQQ